VQVANWTEQYESCLDCDLHYSWQMHLFVEDYLFMCRHQCITLH